MFIYLFVLNYLFIYNYLFIFIFLETEKKEKNYIN